MKCPQCRADVPDAARFCPSCGHELVVVGDQRRIATVLFADLVGFTALSERMDPEQVKALVDRCFARLAEDIEAFGGRVDKVVGDAIVALFGAPVAHEDDAERAVRAGLRMQQTIGMVSAGFAHAVQIRVGINTGEVLVGSVSAGREYTAMGDVVNTASRLQTAAEPGTVVVGPETWAATRQIIAYDELESVVAKGKQLPVRAWVAREAVVPPGHRPQRTQSSLVGRETEMSLLGGLTETAIDRSRASLLLIHGEAGMGKSRLAAETAARAHRELGALVLEGRCVPYGEANVWWPVADALRTATGLEPDADAETVEATLEQVVAISLRESGRLDELDRVVAGLQHLLGHPGALRDIDATRAHQEAIRSVVALAEGYTHRQPLLVVLSDLHWADQEVLELVDTLLTRLARRPFVLLATARRSLRERWNPAPDAANTVVLHLDPLGPEASRRLLFELTDGDVHPAMAAMLVDRAGGNPFYLEELVALINEAGVHTVDQLLASEAGELPSTLRGLVAARLDALSPDDRAVLDDAAVLGRRNRIAALVTMAGVKRGLDPETARANVESLAAREFFVLEGDIYAFRSDVIREVAYSTVTKADRARSHAGIASWLEDNEDTERNVIIDQVANHYAAAAELSADIGNVAGVPDDVHARAVEWLCRASAGAEEAHLPAVVNALATRALDLIDETDARLPTLLRSRAGARVELYDFDAGRADAEAAEVAAAALDDRSAVGQALLLQADAAQHRADFRRAVALLDRAHHEFAAVDDELGCARAHRQTGMVRLLSGDIAAADRSLTAALELFERSGDRRGAAWAHQNLSWSAFVSGRIDEAEARVEQAMQTFEELGDPGGLTWSHGILAWVRLHQGCNDEAVALAAEVGADARERGDRWGEAMMIVLTAAVALWSGRTEEAIETSARAVALFEEIDELFGELQARSGLGRALVMAGQIEAGLDELATARTAAASLEDGPDQVWFTRVATLTSAVQLGHVDLGVEALEGTPTEDRSDQLGGSDYRVALAIHRLQAGDAGGVGAVLDDLQEDRGYVACGRALVAAVAQDPHEAIAAADRVNERPHTYLDSVYGEIARALAQVRLGSLDEARSGLAEAIATVDATGDRLAQAITRLADAAIAEHGDRPDARSVRAVAEQRLSSLGIGAEGWRTLLAEALATVSVR